MAVALTRISRTAERTERLLVQRLPSSDQGLPLCSPVAWNGRAGQPGEETQIFRTFLKEVIYVSFSLYMKYHFWPQTLTKRAEVGLGTQQP